MKNTRRMITIERNEAGFGVVVRSSQATRWHGKASQNDQHALSGASIRRIHRLVNKYGFLTDNGVDTFLDELTVTYTYLPDMAFNKDAQAIDGGAVNPMPILREMLMLGYYRIITTREGREAFTVDPAYLLMLNQLLAISNLRELEFDVYRKAAEALDNG